MAMEAKDTVFFDEEALAAKKLVRSQIVCLSDFGNQCYLSFLVCCFKTSYVNELQRFVKFAESVVDVN
jgi:hypothetical protein